MEVEAPRRANRAALALGYFLLILATALYAGIVYVADIALHQNEPGVPAPGPVAFVRHVILVPGFSPWLITAVWVVTLHFGGSVLKGLGFILLAIFVHYVVFAVSAHDDVVYPWIQLIEILVTTFCLRSMIRSIPNR